MYTGFGLIFIIDQLTEFWIIVILNVLWRVIVLRLTFLGSETHLILPPSWALAAHNTILLLYTSLLQNRFFTAVFTAAAELSTHQNTACPTKSNQ